MLSLENIEKVTKGKFVMGLPAKVARIRGVSIDSRTLKKGELFIAIIGEKQDGHQYIQQAVEKGAAAILVSKRIKLTKEIPVVLVKNTTKALAKIASFYRDQFSVPVIAVTGSSGKTTTKEIVADVLSKKYKVLKNYKSFNNQYGVPLTLLQLRQHHEAVVLEVGTNRPGDIASLASIVKPTTVIFTNIGESHLELLKNKAGVFREKLNLVKYMLREGAIIFNEDDPYLSRVRQKNFSQKLINFSRIKKSSCQALEVVLKDLKIFFNVGKQEFCFPSPAEHNVYNALAAICCGRLFKVSDALIKKALEDFQLTLGRQEISKIGNFLVINDTYNANPVSMRSAIQTLSVIKTQGKKILVLADMLELGKRSKELHQSMGKEIAQSSVDCLITTGHFARYINQGLQKENRKIMNFYCPNLEDVHKLLRIHCQKNDVILVKGSRGMKMERTIQFLKEKFS